MTDLILAQRMSADAAPRPGTAVLSHREYLSFTLGLHPKSVQRLQEILAGLLRRSDPNV